MSNHDEDDENSITKLTEMMKKLERMRPSERVIEMNKSSEEAAASHKRAARHENIFRIIIVSLMLYVFTVITNRPLETWEWVPALLLFIIFAAAISMSIRAVAMLETLVRRMSEVVSVVIQIKSRLDSASGNAKELASVLANVLSSASGGKHAVDADSDKDSRDRKSGPSSGLEDFIK